MNDLIKEFARQAGFKVNWQHEDVQAIKMAQYKEFAELIVKECISEMQISKKVDRYTGEVYDNEYNRAIQDQIEWLKEHFGVEE
jgi:hypothetical protein